jgi:post-segregation antitoxin (ccd killing protein)
MNKNQNRQARKKGGDCMQRTQILLELDLHQQITELARKENLSFSSLVREMLANELRTRKLHQWENAAILMANEYATNVELTAFTALDGEDFHA